MTKTTVVFEAEAGRGVTGGGDLSSQTTITEKAPAPTPWLTAAEAAAYLRLPSARALYKRVERGQVRAHRWGRQLRFHRRDLDACYTPGR